MARDTNNVFSAAAAPVEQVEQAVRKAVKRNLKNMTLSEKYQKILKELGLEKLGFSIENSSIGQSEKYTYTLVSDKKNNTERFLFHVDDSILLQPHPDKTSILSKLALQFVMENIEKRGVNNQERLRFYIFHNTTPHPYYSETFKDYLSSQYNIGVELKYLELINKLEKLYRNSRDDIFFSDIIKTQLERLLDLRELSKPKICGELITLQEIIENLPYSDRGIRTWKAFIEYIDPDMWNFLEKRVDATSFKDSRRAALEIINSLDRFGSEEYGGLRPLLEELLRPNTLIELGKVQKDSVKNMINLYFSPQSLVRKRSKLRILSIEERRKLIDIISSLKIFSNRDGRITFLKDQAELKGFLRSFELDGTPVIVAIDLVCRLEERGFLDESNTYRSLGVLLETMLYDYAEELGTENKTFVAGLIVRHELIDDPVDINKLKRDYGVTDDVIRER